MELPKLKLNLNLNLKDISKNLSFIRNYSFLVIPGVIILIALLLLIPAQLIGNGLKKEINKESIARRAKRVQTLLNDAVANDQWTEESKYRQAQAKDANDIKEMAIETTQRPLLDYRMFPLPKDESTQIYSNFGKEFRKSINELLNEINAKDCPSKTEIESGLNIGGTKRDADVKEDVVNLLCMDRARATSVYLNPEKLPCYNFWEDYKYVSVEKGVEDCWYGQLAYWIIKDVLLTAQSMNSGYENVLEAPLKRIISVEFEASSKESTNNDMPEYVSSPAASSYTQRASGDDIDVVYFRGSFVVSSRSVLDLIKELCSEKKHEFRGFSGDEEPKTLSHNQITVLASSVSPVNVNGRQNEHEYYRYGMEDVAVRVDLICEYIFFKEGYEQIKPESVKKTLGELEEETEIAEY